MIKVHDILRAAAEDYGAAAERFLPKIKISE